MDRISTLKAGTSLQLKKDNLIFCFKGSRFKSLDIFYLLYSDEWGWVEFNFDAFGDKSSFLQGDRILLEYAI